LTGCKRTSQLVAVGENAFSILECVDVAGRSIRAPVTTLVGRERRGEIVLAATGITRIAGGTIGADRVCFRAAAAVQRLELGVDGGIRAIDCAVARNHRL
jgi:hypothetical protein